MGRSWKVGSLVVLLLLTVSGADAGILHMFAASSLTDALKSIAEAYEKKTGEKVVFTFGSSNFLAQQIVEGAPADLFFSADETQMDRLDEKGMLLPGGRRSLLSNTLVVVIPKGSGFHLSDFKDLASPKIKRLALADPAGVPAGVYAKQYLEKTGLWDGLSRRVVLKDNVRAALSAVGSKNCDAAIVYRTDARITRKVKVIWEVDEKDGPRISYPVAVIRSSDSPDRAMKFLKFLTSQEAKVIFTKFGFLHTVPPEVKKKAMDRTSVGPIARGAEPRWRSRSLDAPARHTQNLPLDLSASGQGGLSTENRFSSLAPGRGARPNYGL